MTMTLNRTRATAESTESTESLIPGYARSFSERWRHPRATSSTCSATTRLNAWRESVERSSMRGPLLLALVLVDQRVTLDAAGALLRHTWIGQADLVSHFRGRLESLDDDTRELWLARLAPDSDDFGRGPDNEQPT